MDERGRLDDHVPLETVWTTHFHSCFWSVKVVDLVGCLRVPQSMSGKSPTLLRTPHRVSEVVVPSISVPSCDMKLSLVHNVYIHNSVSL